jgi:hypothetical protein
LTDDMEVGLGIDGRKILEWILNIGINTRCQNEELG